MPSRRFFVVSVVVLALGGAAAGGWWAQHEAQDPPPGFERVNGRAEATRIDVATKRAARVAEVLVVEGDVVSADQVVARMDARDLEAAALQARAELRRAREDQRYAAALIAQAESDLVFANQQAQRSEQLISSGGVARERLDSDRNRKAVAEAMLQAARIRNVEADAAVEAAQARVQQIEIDLGDSVLRAPRGGRVQHRIAEPGEVLAAGGRVLALIDLDDVYMTLFLSEAAAGRVAIGAEVRVVFDAFPDRPVPAHIAFVADQAQFTPKTVETHDERQKLAFRAKARIEVGARYRPYAKPGLPGVAYVRLDPRVDWPARLATDWMQP